MNPTQLQLESSASEFLHRFGSLPAWQVLAPGRVNLIGEHTDYNNLPVLPMPIDRFITITFSERSDNKVCLHNVNSQFSSCEISLDETVVSHPGHWSNYCRAAIQAALADDSFNGKQARGFNGLIKSTLPTASGVSSSSALVIATCLALLQANQVEWTMQKVAERMRLAEQFVGTAGGGMDQAVISLGQENKALLIEFDPLLTAPVTLPVDIAIFVINSGQKAEKSGAARFAFNRRALECTLGVELLKKAAPPDWEAVHWSSLRDVYLACKSRSVSWKEVVLKWLPTEAQSLPAIAASIGQDRIRQLSASKLLDLDESDQWLPSGMVMVFHRVMHVLGEADRVYGFKEALVREDNTAAYCHSRASHDSCRDLYQISTPAIEKLISTAERCGAGSARITGAGFGGCIVALVPEKFEDRFAERMEEQGIIPENIIRATSLGGAKVRSLTA